MEALLALVGLVLLFVALVSPVLAIVAFISARRARSEVEMLRREVLGLETRLDGLARAPRTAAPAAVSTAVTPPTPAQPPLPTTAAPMPAASAEPPAPPRTPAPAPPTAAIRIPPASTPVPRAASGEPTPPAAASPPAAAPPPRPAAPPPRPPEAPAPSAVEPPPPPAAPAFDWESLLGVRGAAWIGGIAFVIAAILFAKFAIDQGLITPAMRVALLIGTGVSLLLGAELNLRRGYATTANAVSGAGIAVLYVGFFAARAMYDLISMPVAFACMTLVTVVAGLLAIRYDAYFTAVLGLLGGFATPWALSSGRDNPVGLFSYVLLLNLGLLTIAVRRGWHGLSLIGLAGTFVIEVGWFGRYMSPEKMLIGTIAFLVLAVLYVIVPLLARDGDEESGTLAASGALGGIAPFVFALALAGNRRYVAEWPILFAFVGLLDAALLAVAIARGRVVLAIGAAAATAVTLSLWAGQSLSADLLWAPTLAAIAIVALVNAGPRLARWLETEVDRRGLEVAGLLATAGLGLFGLILAGRDLAEPPGPFLCLLAALSLIVLERMGEERLPGIAAVAPLAVAALAQVGFFTATNADNLPRNLAVPLLLAAFFSFAASWRARDGGTVGEVEIGVLGATAAVYTGLLGCLFTTGLGGDPLPLFVALVFVAALLVVSALRSGWTLLVTAAAAASAFYMTAWQAAYFDADGLVLFAFAAAFYVAFVTLPFVLSDDRGRDWRQDPLAWLTAALSGPAFFVVLRRGFEALGGAEVIGLLPVAMGAVSVMALGLVRRRFEDAEPHLRLRYLALFAAVALGFVAVAIPLQLDRQWITIGYALEAAAVFWLYGRLPHPGLRILGVALFAVVGVRLLANPEALRYEERGLPIFNWLLYTYGVPILACAAGAAFLRRAEAKHETPTRFPAGVSLLGLLLLFALINLQIFDYFGQGRFVEVSFARRAARDLVMSAAWGLYAFGLLIAGVWRGVRELRFVSLGFLILTVAKVFLYDLSNLGGVYRILSFLGLGISLILVSLFYQRFVFRKEAP